MRDVHGSDRTKKPTKHKPMHGRGGAYSDCESDWHEQGYGHAKRHLHSGQLACCLSQGAMQSV